MGKRLLILGIGHVQCDAIRWANEHGHSVSAVAWRPEGPGLPLVESFNTIDIADRKRVLEYARNWPADIVCSVGSDIAVPTLAYVSAQLRLPCFTDMETAELLQNKGALRAFLNAHDISPIPFLVTSSRDDLLRWHDFPAIIKPVDSQGQRGVCRCNDANALARQFNAALRFSRCGQVIVEQFVKGEEVSVNLFMQDGKILHSFVTDRLVVPDLPGGFVRGHRMPSGSHDDVQRRIRDLASRMVQALGIRNGPVYFQMKHDRDDVWLIEAAPRLDGCHLWRLIQMATGVDLLDLTFRQLLGLPIQDAQDAAGRHTARHLTLDFFLQPPASVCSRATHKPGTALYREWYYQDGETVRPVNEVAEKIGYQIRETDS